MSRFQLGIQKQTKIFKDINGAVRIWRRNSAGSHKVLFKIASMAEFYEYASLDRLPPDIIRLLDLQPGTGCEGIQMRDLSRALGRPTQILRLVLHVGRPRRGRADKTKPQALDDSQEVIELSRVPQTSLYSTAFLDRCYLHIFPSNHNEIPQFFEGFNFTHLVGRI